MKFTSALITAVLAAAPALGFLIPADQPDGVYEVTQDTNGEYVFNEIAKISASPKPDIGRRSRISGRSGLDEIFCMNQGALNRANTDAANANLNAQIGPNGRGVGSHLSIYAKSGAVVAYCCNNRQEGNTCFQSVHKQADQLITTKCGAYQAGSAYDSGAHLTYGYEGSQYSFCPSS